MLTFGNDLWDQLPTIESYTGEGIKFLDDCNEFFKERARMEAEHARSLQKLTNHYLPSAKSKHHHQKQKLQEGEEADASTLPASTESISTATPEEESRLRDLKQFTLISSWYTILQQSRHQAFEQEQLANELHDNVASTQKTFLREKEHERKQYMSDANELKDHMKKRYKALEKSKATYDRKKKKADDAKLVYERYQRDVNSSEQTLNKHRDALTRRNEKALLAETNYQNELTECNQAQEDFFKRNFPEKLNQLQALEEARIDHMKDILTRFVSAVHRGNAVNQASYDQMLQSCENINRDVDIQSFINTNKSGEPMPGLIGFQPFNPSLGVTGSYGAYGFLVKPGENVAGSQEWQQDSASISSQEDAENALNRGRSQNASYASLKPLPSRPNIQVQQLPSNPTNVASRSSDNINAMNDSFAQQSLAYPA